MKHARNGKFLPNFCHWQNPAKLLTLANGKWQMTNKVILQSPFLGNTTHLTPAADGEADKEEGSVDKEEGNLKVLGQSRQSRPRKAYY
jgi:hypothetical protein